MVLKDLNLKGLYDSDKDDLLMDFYIPVLGESIIYKRIAGYFCSNALAIASKGLVKFINNNGKMYLIANIILSEDDQTTISEAIAEKEKEILHDIETMDDALKKGHLRLLAWMIKNDKIEIKIAKVRKGIEHKKKGILEDSEGNIVSFSGSDNETVSGWLYNDEDFHVFCSWIEGDKERHLKPDIESFDRLWSDTANKVRVYDVSEAFRLDLVKIAPKNEIEFQSMSNEIARELIKLHKNKQFDSETYTKILTKENLHLFLRDYQKEAIIKWEKNGNMGILEMATGTGKTFVAIAAMNRHLEKKEKAIVVIVAPKQLLVSQWYNGLRDLGFTNVIKAMGNSSIWRKEFKSSLLQIELEREKVVFVITTYNSFCSSNFIELIKSTDVEKLLISDEMHRSWAPQFKKGLLNAYTKRLGLSATPERYMDEIGTNEMQEYFGGIVFSFKINEAIPDYLVPYEYFAEITELTLEEKEEYEKLTKNIVRKIAANDDEINDSILQLFIKRSKIVANSESKWSAFEKILDNINDIRKTLIYCSERQIKRVLEILHSRKIPSNKITYEEPLEFREEIIDLFNSDDYKTIVAIKVLDEGIDIPGIERAIILASSGNPIEYIQRRGRILRKSANKRSATIHDILIFPWIDIPRDVISSEITLIKKELRRVEEFVGSSMNPLEVMNKIARFKSLIN